MNIVEILMKVYLIKDVPHSEVSGILADFIDSYLIQDQFYKEFHEHKKLKHYCFDGLFPVAKGQNMYKGDAVYQFRVRTPDRDLAAYLAAGLANHQTRALKGLTRTVKNIPHRQIREVYTLTPVVIKNPDGKGYWRDYMSFVDFEQSLKSSMIHKYENITGEKIDVDESLYDQIELLSKMGIGISYKGIKMIGDKVSIQVADNETAQKVFYYALGGGLGTMGARGMGFLGYKFV